MHHLVSFLILAHIATAEAPRPNIVLILADDIGYGDLGCYGATQVKTPNLDRLAREGVRCTDAHATAAVCTPSRYAILTGQYAWRNPMADHILSGVAPLCIPTAMPTLPAFLAANGYDCALAGKWHLGIGTEAQPVNYNADITPGPLEIGFKRAFFIPATGDRVPCVFVEDHRIVNLDPADPIQVSYGKKIGDDPTGDEHPELLKIKADRGHSQTIVNGISRIGYMNGGKAARWIDEDIADILTRKACDYIAAAKDRPFFLYFTPHDIHEPMVPHARFKGTSDCGSRGDVIQELDWSVGEILNSLDRLGLAENTLVFFSSDNGGAIKDTYDDGTNPLHSRQPPNGNLRGEKNSLYEGGHRVPLLARWPKHIAPNATSDQLIGLVDLFATCAAILDKPLPNGAAPDSLNALPALVSNAPVRDELVLQTNGPNNLALRQGPWMFIPGKGATPELYNLSSDPGETTNVAQDNPDLVAQLRDRLSQMRSASGPVRE